MVSSETGGPQLSLVGSAATRSRSEAGAMIAVFVLGERVVEG
jgi:hypothetical protein